MDLVDRHREILDHLNSLFPGRVRLNAKEAADALGISRQTIYNKIGDPTFPIRPISWGRQRGFAIVDIARFLSGELRAE